MAAFNVSLVMRVMWIYCWTSRAIILLLLKSHLNAMLYLAAASFKERMKEYDGGGCSMGRKQFCFMRKCIFPRLIAFLSSERNIKILQNRFRSSFRALELSTPLNDPFLSRLNLMPRVSTMNIYCFHQNVYTFFSLLLRKSFWFCHPSKSLALMKAKWEEILSKKLKKNFEVMTK